MAGIFQTFYILFKSNAEEVEKKTRSAEKAGKDLEENLGKQNKQAEELGKNFTKIVEGLTSAVTAYVSFGAIKSGILNQAAFNTALERTSEVTGQNVRDMAVYGAALEQFGGSTDTFQQTIRQMTQIAAEQGRQLPPLAGFLRQINREFQGLSLNETSRRGGLLGISDPAMLQLLRQTPQEFDKIISAQENLVPVTAENARVSQEFERSLLNVRQAFAGLFTVVGADVLPTLTKFLNKLAEFAVYMQGHNILSEVGLTGAAAGMTALSGVIISRLIPAFVGLTLAAAPWLAGIALLAGAGIAGVAAYDHFFGNPKDTAVPRKPSPGGASAIDFWMSKGYTRNQAAAWAANEQAESSGNPGARNSGHYGLYQWSEERRRNIMLGLGVDVATASIEEQRRAAAWEAQQRGDDKRVQASGSIAAATGSITRNFERPASGAALEAEVTRRSIMAAKIAIDTASSSPYAAAGNVTSVGGDKNIAVSMGEVHIHSQATDARGVAVDLNGHIQNAISNSDDGVAM